MSRARPFFIGSVGPCKMCWKFSLPVHEPVEIVNGQVKKSSQFQPVLKHELLSEYWFNKKKSIENRRN